MSKNTVFCLLLSCLIMVFSGILYAEEMTLENTIAKAFSANTEIKNAAKSIDAAKSSAFTQGTFLNPEATLEFAKNTGGSIGFSAIEVSQPFEQPGVLQLKSKIASNRIAYCNSVFKETAAAVYSGVVSKFYGVNLAFHKEILAKENLQYLQRLYGVVESNYRSGKSNKTEMQRAKIGMLEAEKEYLEAENSRLNEAAELKIMLDMEQGDALDLAAEEPVVPEDSRIMALLEEYAVSNPAVVKAALESDTAECNVWMEQLRRLPSITAGISMQKEGVSENYTGLLGISLPLWNLNQGEAGRAGAEYEAAKNFLQLAKKKAGYEASALLREVKLAAKRMEIAREEATNANELAKLTQQMYMDGKLDLVGYYDRMRTAFESKVKYYEEIRAVAVAVSNITKYSAVSNYFKEKK
jgi:outer membrane protein TolC